MFTNHLKIAFRRLLKHKSFSFLNIAGLAVGVACAALILLWAYDEITYDGFHEKGDRIFQVMSNQTFDGKTFTFASLPGIFAGAAKAEIPEIAKSARLSWETSYAFSLGEKSSFEQGYLADSSFLDIMSFPLVEGDPKTALLENKTLLITERMAEKFFGKEPAVGKLLKVNNRDEFKVAGVMKNPPANSTLKFEWLASFRIFEKENDWWNTWNTNGVQTFVLLNSATDSAVVNRKIHGFVKAKSPTASAKPLLFALNDWHLRSEFKEGRQTGRGRILLVKLFSLIAAFILLIACFNYMNLTTARSENRRREVGVRKVVGAGRGSLAGQFMGEALLTSLLACVLAFAMLKLAIPFFNTLVDKQLAFNLTNPLHLGGLLGVAVLSGLLAGIYPSLYLTSFRPIAVLKASVGSSAKAGGGIFATFMEAGSIRKGLVVAQFVVSVFLIFCTIVVYKQIGHVKSRNLGYDKEGLIFMPTNEQFNTNYPIIKQELLASGLVEQVAKSSDQVLNMGSNTSGYEWDGKDPSVDKLITVTSGSPEYIKTLGMKLTAGRDFHENPALDSTSVIINETLANIILRDGKKEEVVGELLRRGDEKLQIVGVLEDFRYGNIYGEVEPLMLFCSQPEDGMVWARLKPGVQVDDALAAVGAVVKSHNPGFPFEYEFLDDEFNKRFKMEATMGQLSLIFSVLSILICCLGLFGLAAFAAERRTKEIGVRKVLGANVAGIVGLLSREFIALVLIALVIAAPLAWWAANTWLENYEYRITISWWMLGLAGAMAVAVAFITVSFQSVKAALANPVKSLRSE